MNICRCGSPEDCQYVNNKCDLCSKQSSCDWPWVSKLWEANGDLLSPCLPGWIKPYMRSQRIISVTNIADFCVFTNPRSKDYITINDMCVAQSLRGQGTARQLITYLMDTYDKDIRIKCIKESSAESFWKHLGVKLYEEPSKQRIVCCYEVKNPNKKIRKKSLF